MRRRAAGAAGLVNAVLRRAARERDALLGSLTDDDPAAAAVAHSAPEWLAAMWWDGAGRRMRRASLLRAINEPPETALRVNTLRADPAELRAELEAAGEPVAPAPPVAGVELARRRWSGTGPLGAAALASLDDGRARSPRAAPPRPWSPLLDPRPGERVLDLCAGPGVKTTAIAARMGGEGEVVAVERDPAARGQIDELVRARGRAQRPRRGRGRRRPRILGPGYDRVLVDPPCSDLGTLASRPDARWRKDPATIERLAGEQAAILAARPRGAAPGRHARLLDLHDLARARTGTWSQPRRRLPEWPVLETRPDRDRTDGFFIARLRRSAPVSAEGDAAAAELPRVRRAVASARPRCPGRFRCVFCLQRYELVSQCPDCGEHQTIVRMSRSEDMVCQHCRHSMLRPV